jgi:hypothetical protein
MVGQVMSNQAFLARVNAFADVLIKLDTLCRQPLRLKVTVASAPVIARAPIRLAKGRRLRRLSARNRTSHYRYLTGRRLHRVNLWRSTGKALRKKANVFMPLVGISQQLIALGLTRAQIWPHPRKTGVNDGRHSRTFWLRHTDYQLLEILELARRGWLAKMLQAHPRLEGQDDEESKLLNVLFQNVERLFANHGITLNG